MSLKKKLILKKVGQKTVKQRKTPGLFACFSQNAKKQQKMKKNNKNAKLSQTNQKKTKSWFCDSGVGNLSETDKIVDNWKTEFCFCWIYLMRFFPIIYIAITAAVLKNYWFNCKCFHFEKTVTYCSEPNPYQHIITVDFKMFKMFSNKFFGFYNILKHFKISCQSSKLNE